MWTAILAVVSNVLIPVAVPLLTNLLGGVLSAQQLYPSSAGDEKKNHVISAVSGSVEALQAANALPSGMDNQKIYEHVSNIITGVVSLFKLMGIFKSNAEAAAAAAAATAVPAAAPAAPAAK